MPCWQRPRAQRRPSEHAGNHSDQHLISPTPPAANPNLLQWGHDAGVPAGCCWCAPCPAGVGNHPAARAGGGAPGVTRWGVETTTILHCACGGSGRQPGAHPSGVTQESGGQIQASFSKNFGGGSFRVYAKVLDDRTPTLLPVPTTVVNGQIQGGIAQGVGQALLEHGVYDETGQLLSGSFMDYAMPRADTFPMFQTARTETPSPSNPLGVKGAGEMGTIAATVTVANAVMDALAPLGIRHLEMPLTAEKIWHAIQNAKQNGGN